MKNNELVKEDFKTSQIAERKAIVYLETIFPEIQIEEITSIDGYDSHDFTALSGRTYLRGEVKIRKFDSIKYPTAVLELDKVNRLMKENKDDFILQNRRLLYFAFYREDKKLVVFDIMSTPSTLTYEYCPKTTVGDDNEMIHKPMMNFKIEDAIITIKYK